ncbi:MAG: RNA polymerase sigma factor, partial [Clostridiales bacterium]|nr:RNA polymerase sigma factor [Clostridiales bacterium]
MLILLTFASESERLKFERLFDKYKKLLLYTAYNILHDYSLAEDAVSEAYIRIYFNLHKIEDTESPKSISFMVTIVKNTALTILGKEKKYIVPQDDIEIADGGYNMEESVISDAITGDMLKIVDGLKEELREPFLLQYAHGLSHKQIA